MTQLNRLSRLLILLAAITALTVAFTGTASAASSDYSSPDGICYTNGWCHWNEVCYDTFGGCYFDFWCPNGATSPGQCLYYGGFAPYATAASSASGSGSSGSSNNSSTGVITGGSFDLGNSGTDQGGESTVTGGSFDGGSIDGEVIGYQNCNTFGNCIDIGSGSSGSNSSSDAVSSMWEMNNLRLVLDGLWKTVYFPF
jgi:hypothetical protein